MKTVYLSTGFCFILCSFMLQSKAQNIFPPSGRAGIATTTPHNSALLDLDTTGLGLLIPRMTTAQRNNIVSPATGLLIFQTNGASGFYFYDGSGWKQVGSGVGANKSLGNLTSPTAINQILLPDVNDVRSLGSSGLQWKNIFLSGAYFLNGNSFISNLGGGTFVGANAGSINAAINNTGIGYEALLANVIGDFNTATGYQSLRSNNTGNNNTAYGYQALSTNSGGSYNTALGSSSLFINSSGNYNTAVGGSSLYSNGSGSYNSTLGYGTLNNNTTGNNNVAIGAFSLYNNTKGFSNIAIGSGSLQNVSEGANMVAVGDSALFQQQNNTALSEFWGVPYYFNTAVGSKALFSSQNGYSNTAVGSLTLYSNNNGHSNTALGGNALYSDTSGYQNTAIGFDALSFNLRGYGNTAVGASAMRNAFNEGNYNTAIGNESSVNNGVTNATSVGFQAYATASNQVRIGNSIVTSIGGYANWTNISDGRVKKNIKDNVPGLAFINKLKPVTYNLNLDAADKILQQPVAKNERGNQIEDKAGAAAKMQRTAKEKIIYSGFVAQQVEQAAKSIGYDFSGVDAAKDDKDLYGLRYAEFVVPLVKAVQELDAAQQSAISYQRQEIDELKKEIAALRVLLSGISNQPSAVSNQQTAISGQQSAVINNQKASVEQNRPNPFTGNTTIDSYIPTNKGNVYINFYNQSGALLKSVKVTGQGKNTLTLHANELAAGIYQYALVVDEKVVDTKMMLKL